MKYDFDVNHTHYDYLAIPPSTDDAWIEAAYLKMLEHLQYGSTDAGQDLSWCCRNRSRDKRTTLRSRTKRSKLTAN